MHIAECRLYHYLKTYYGCLKWIGLCTGMGHYSIGGTQCTLHVGLGPGQIIYISYPDANPNQGHTCLVVVKLVKMAILQCPRHVTLSCYTEAISLSLARCTVIYSVISQQFQLGNAVLLEMKHATTVLQTIGPELAVWRNGGHKLWAEGHRRRSGWDSGDAWRALKVVWCRVGGVWRGVSLPQPTRGPGERRQLVERGPGQSPGRKRILTYFERHRMLFFTYMTKSEGENLRYRPPTPNSGGPGDLRPCGGVHNVCSKAHPYYLCQGYVLSNVCLSVCLSAT